MPSLYPGEEELLSLLDSLALADDPMFVIDDRHRIVFWNRAIERLIGRTHDEVAGRSCETILDGHDHYGNRYCAELCPVQMIARRNEAVRHFELRLRTKAGSAIQVDVSVVKFTLRTSKRVLLAHLVRPVEEAVIQPPVQEPAARLARGQLPHELTTREAEILSLLAEGRNVRQIAEALHISPLTARNHIQHILEKLEVHSQSEAVALAWKSQLV
jgi:PAS domain S-box-containing protein